jgi:hypothetical protein
MNRDELLELLRYLTMIQNYDFVFDQMLEDEHNRMIALVKKAIEESNEHRRKNYRRD